MPAFLSVALLIYGAMQFHTLSKVWQAIGQGKATILQVIMIFSYTPALYPYP